MGVTHYPSPPRRGECPDFPPQRDVGATIQFALINGQFKPMFVKYTTASLLNLSTFTANYQVVPFEFETYPDIQLT